MKFLRLGLITLLLPPACAAQDEALLETAVNSITAEDIVDRISVIAHDSMGGRTTPSRGLELTASYIAREFERFGLTPGGDDGTFVQRYTLDVVQLDPAGSSIEFAGGPTLRFPEDLAQSIGRLGPEELTAPVILVQGIAQSANELAELPLPGSFVIYTARTEADGSLGSATRRTVFNLYRQRPSVLLVVADFSDDAWRAARNYRPRTQLVIRGEAPTGRLVLLAREGSLHDVLKREGVAGLGTDGSDGMTIEHRALTGVHVTVRQARTVLEEHSAPNVVGVLEGSDPELKSEYIVFSGHMDHVGTAGEPFATCEARGDDSICNGADDDASGTVAVVEAAEAFAQLRPRPRRSMIFLTVSGEEKGLLGSRFFANNPPVPIDEIVANINFDMVGRNWSDTIVVIGKEHSDLGQTLERVAGSHPELGMTPIDDLWPGERFYFRSDHFNFARRGVPILFFFNGTHDDYHQPGDETAKIDGDKMARIGRLTFYLGLDVANAEQRPKWDPDSYRQIVTAASSTSPE